VIAMKKKFSPLTASAMLAATLAGCAENAPPQMQVIYVCPAGYYLATGNLCWPVAPPQAPPARYADASPSAADPPASQPAPPPAAGEPAWAHDLKTAGAGAAIGGVIGNQLAKRGAAEALAGGVGEVEAGAALGEAGAATVVTEGASAAAGAAEVLEGAELGELLLGIGELAIELLPFGISSHQSWHGIVRHPVYVVRRSSAL
jgi:hypothetical protein